MEGIYHPEEVLESRDIRYNSHMKVPLQDTSNLNKTLSTYLELLCNTHYNIGMMKLLKYVSGSKWISGMLITSINLVIEYYGS